MHIVNSGSEPRKLVGVGSETESRAMMGLLSRGHHCGPWPRPSGAWQVASVLSPSGAVIHSTQGTGLEGSGGPRGPSELQMLAAETVRRAAQK